MPDRQPPYRPDPPTAFAPLPAAGRLVSVLVRTRDRPTLLPRALDSIRRQTVLPLEVVIANDGGDPAPVEAAAQALVTNGIPVLLLHAATPAGRSAAAAAAASASQGPLLALLDDDDSWEPGFLAAATTRFQAPDAPLLAGVHSWWTIVDEEPASDGTMRMLSRRTLRIGYPPYSALARFLQPAGVQPQALVMRREAYDRAGGWDPALSVGEDWELQLRLVAEGEIAVIPEPLANWHRRSGTAAGTSPLANATASAEDYVAFQVAYWNRQIRAMMRAEPGFASTALLLGQIQHGQGTQGTRLLDALAEARSRLERLESLLAEAAARAAAQDARLQAIEGLLQRLAASAQDGLRPGAERASMPKD